MVQVHCVLFSSVKKKKKTTWNGPEMSLAESEVRLLFQCCEPALQPRAAQSVSLVLRFLSVR